MRRSSIIVASGVLAGLWFVPETWILGPIFHWELLNGASLMQSVTMVSGPACGALLLVLALAPVGVGYRRAGGAILGTSALVLPLLGAATGIIVSPLLAIPAASAMALLAALAIVKERIVTAHLLLLVVPLALLASYLASVVVDDMPLYYLAGLKVPIRIWAASLAISASLPPDRCQARGYV